MKTGRRTEPRSACKSPKIYSLSTAKPSLPLFATADFIFLPPCPTRIRSICTLRDTPSSPPLRRRSSGSEPLQRAESRVVREQQKPVYLIDISVREQTVAHRFAYILDGFFSGAIHFLRKPLEGYALLIADHGPGIGQNLLSRRFKRKSFVKQRIPTAVQTEPKMTSGQRLAPSVISPNKESGSIRPPINGHTAAHSKRNLCTHSKRELHNVIFTELHKILPSYRPPLPSCAFPPAAPVLSRKRADRSRPQTIHQPNTAIISSASPPRPSEGSGPPRAKLQSRTKPAAAPNTESAIGTAARRFSGCIRAAANSRRKPTAAQR